MQFPPLLPSSGILNEIQSPSASELSLTWQMHRQARQDHAKSRFICQESVRRPAEHEKVENATDKLQTFTQVSCVLGQVHWIWFVRRLNELEVERFS